MPSPLNPGDEPTGERQDVTIFAPSAGSVASAPASVGVSTSEVPAWWMFDAFEAKAYDRPLPPPPPGVSKAAAAREFARSIQQVRRIVEPGRRRYQAARGKRAGKRAGTRAGTRPRERRGQRTRTAASSRGDPSEDPEPARGRPLDDVEIWSHALVVARVMLDHLRRAA